MNQSIQKVAIVDDELGIRKSLSALLDAVQLESFTFESAEDFLATDSFEQFDAMIVDFRLPGISGIDLVKRLRDAGLKIPTVLVSGHGELEIDHLLQLHPDIKFLKKPFRPAELFAILGVEIGKRVT